MNNKKKYETPEMMVTKFEVEKDIMADEQNSDEYIEMPITYESATTIADFEWD